MTLRRKSLLAFILLVVAAFHIGLFAAGGIWRTLGKILVLVDVFSAWLFFTAIKETRKLEHSQQMEGKSSVNRED
jgi:hypothetical protein